MSKKIAMLCMSLNIGGAETHIYELSKQLKKEGNDVTVFSNGGVYASALEEAGVRHIQAPLHSKKIGALLKSYKILKKFFSENRPDVVHSHTRISNYIGGKVCKKLGIPMVTTVHFNFKSGLIFRLLSNWGVRALAVSEDLKNYLAAEYRYNPDHIRLTVNGIDMERFCRKESNAFRASLGIEEHHKMVLLVSRLDKEASIHVDRFLNVAADLYRENNNSRVVIVGNGDSFNDFCAKVEKINAECHPDFIRMEGARTNIEQYTAAADLFIGISRSALEAMSAELPTILLGNLGYLGLYSDAIKKECIETNLTCRGYPYPPDSELLKLIIRCLNRDHLKKEIEEGKKLVADSFSIQTMSATAMEQYAEAIQALRPNDYIISGYYGSDNFGDKLTLECLMQHLSAKKGCVLTCNIDSTNVPDEVELVHRFNLIKIRKIMKQTKVFLLGSGSILQDTTSNRSIFYYHYIMKMALKYGCKTMLYANGVGPIRRERNRQKTAKLLNRFDLITARDQNTIDFLKELNVCTPAILTADDAFSFNFSAISPIEDHPIAEGKTPVGINFKLPPASPMIDEIAKALALLAERHSLYYFLIPLHGDQDRPALERLHQQLDQCSDLIEDTSDPERLIGYIARNQYQIFERLHGQIISAALGIPFLPIQYDPKNQSFLEALGLDRFLLNHSDIDREALVQAFEKILSDSDTIRERLEEYTKKAQEAALQNRKNLIKLIEE